MDRVEGETQNGILHSCTCNSQVPSPRNLASTCTCADCCIARAATSGLGPGEVRDLEDYALSAILQSDVKGLGLLPSPLPLTATASHNLHTGAFEPECLSSLTWGAEGYPRRWLPVSARVPSLQKAESVKRM